MKLTGKIKNSRARFCKKIRAFHSLHSPSVIKAAARMNSARNGGVGRCLADGLRAVGKGEGEQMSYYGHGDTRNGAPVWVPHKTK